MEKFFEKYKTEIFILGISIVIFLLVRKKLKNLFENKPQLGIPPGGGGGGQTIPPGGQTIPPGQTITPAPGNKDDWAVNDIKAGSKLYAKKNTKVIADVDVPDTIPGVRMPKIYKTSMFLAQMKLISEDYKNGRIIEIQNEAPLGFVEKVIEVTHTGLYDYDYFKVAKLKYNVPRYVIFAESRDGTNWTKFEEAKTIQLMP